MRPLLAAAAIALLAVALAAGTAAAEEAEAPRVVKFEVDRTTVYRGYQTIEVVAYILSEGRPTVEAKAVLEAGVRVEVDLALVRLMAPVEVTVDNETYSVRYIVIGRLPVPVAASVGKARLVVTVNGTADGVSFYNETEFEITVLNHQPVEDARFRAYLALERARSILLSAQALGVDVTEEVEQLSRAEALLAEADDMLFVRGMVEEAVAAYREAGAQLDRVASSVLVKMAEVATRLSELGRRVGALEAELAALREAVQDAASKLEELSLEVRDSLETLREAVVRYGDTLERFSQAVNDAITTLAGQVSAVSESVSRLSDDASAAIDALARSVADLNSKVDRVAEAQRGLASLVDSLQTAVLVVAAVLVLVALINLVALRRVAAR